MDHSKLKETEEILLRLFTDRKYLYQVSSEGRLPNYPNYNFDRRGASIYAAVLQTNRLETMKAIYPRTAKVLADHFERIIKDYGLALNKLVKSETDGSKNFLLNKSGIYFPKYFQLTEQQLSSKYPYLETLILFEAATAELADMAEPERSQTDRIVSQKGMQGGLRINPCHKIFRFQYDIAELIKAVDASENPGNLHFPAKEVVMLMLRNPSTYKIRLLEINNLTALLIEYAAGGNRAIEDLTAIAQDHCLLPAESLNKHIKVLVEELKNEFVFV
ncbi:MAG: hypothetical protein IPM93_17535 [Candidatus Obscuribacter sp.]|nr:hypothetical protein [Candidatus Obscuribacter sp.]